MVSNSAVFHWQRFNLQVVQGESTIFQHNLRACVTGYNFVEIRAWSIISQRFIIPQIRTLLTLRGDTILYWRRASGCSGGGDDACGRSTRNSNTDIITSQKCRTICKKVSGFCHPGGTFECSYHVQHLGSTRYFDKISNIQQ